MNDHTRERSTNAFFPLSMSSYKSVISQYKIDRDETCYENYDPYFPDQPVVDLYLSTWATLPAFTSKPAFIWAEDGGKRSSISYGELNSRVDSMAAQLLLPLERGDTILVLASPGLDLVKTLFSCQRAGLLSVPISPPQLLPHQSFINKDCHRLIRVLNQTKPNAAIAQRSYITNIHQYLANSQVDAQFSALLKCIKWLVMEEFDNQIGRTLNNVIGYSGCGADDVYLIQYTSGGTGIPKPVLVTAGSAAHNVRAARKAYDLHPNSIIHSWLPQYHDCGLMFLLLTVVAGATCVLASPLAFVHRPRLWLELLSEYGATCTPVPSFALPLVLKRGRGGDHGQPPLQLGKLRNLVLINEHIYTSSVVQFVEEFSKVGLSPSSISPSYGLAENCTFVCTSWRPKAITSNIISDTYRSSDYNMLHFPTYKKLLPSARLAPSSSPSNHDQIQGDHAGEDECDQIEIIVVDGETLEPSEDGVEGEIWVSSPSNASGYLGYPSLTREVFHGRLGGKVSKRYVRTGDAGVVKGKERFLFVVGRTSDIIKIEKINGETEKYHCHYLETSAYESCPNLLRGGCIAAFQISPKVIGMVAELQVDREKIKKGTVASEKSIKIDYKEICQRIDESVVKEYGDISEVDRLVILVRGGSLPKTTSGKIQRWAARDQVMSGEMVAAGESIGRPLHDLPWLMQRRNVDFKRVGKQVVEFQIFFHDNYQLKVTTHCPPSCL